MFIYFFSDRVLFCSMISKKNKKKLDIITTEQDFMAWLTTCFNQVMTWLDLLEIWWWPDLTCLIFFFFSSHSNLGVAWDLLARLWYFGFFVSIKQKQTYQKQIYAVVSAQSVIFSVSCSTWEQTSSGCDSKQLEGNFGSSKSK